MVQPVAVFGSETWAATERDVRTLGTWDRKILRMIYGPVAEQEMWGKRTDQQLKELCRDLDIVADLKKKILEWIGHVVRMD